MRAIFMIFGVALLILSILMLIPMIISIIYDESKTIFFISALITLTASISLIFFGKLSKMSSKQIIIVTSTSWLITTIFASLPFYIDDLSYTDAFFEAMSGITTTGSTILTSVESQKKSILIWRALLHGIGGLGIIVISISIFPMFKGADNVLLFHSESSETESFSNTKRISSYVTCTYLILISICCAMYMVAGMDVFDAICHSISTVSTGGFSNYSNSFTHYHSYLIDYIAILFMFLGALPFVLYIKLIRIDLTILYDEQVKWLLIIILLFFIPVLIDAVATKDLHEHNDDFINSIRLALFNTVSIVTTTGFIEENYNTWSVGSANVIMFCLVFIGGCAGSTAGGIKIFRIIILLKHSSHTIKHILSPHKIDIITINGNKLPINSLSRAYSFFFIFIILHLLCAIFLSMSGLDFTTSLSSSAAAITNSGPGIGSNVGPYGNFSSLSDVSKWLLSFLMIVGRLEIFTIMAFISLLLEDE